MYNYRVHNLQEASRPVPSGYTSWLDYWEKATKEHARWCHNVDCSGFLRTATDGAHVQLDDPTNNKWYIVPLCHSCNCQFGAYFVVRGPLVSATDPNDILW